MAYQSQASSSDITSSAAAILELCKSLCGRRYASSLAEYRRAFVVDDPALLPFFPPPLAFRGDSGCVTPLPSAHPLPFLTTSAGAGPASGVPASLPRYLGLYCSNCGDMPPHVVIDDSTQPCYASLSEACGAIQQAATERRRLWMLTMLPEMPHPPWWPTRARSISSYEQLIVGCGASSVGMHRDRFRPDRETSASSWVATSCERLMCTYISLAIGVKHVILLPPTPAGAALAEQIGGKDCDEPEQRRESARTHFPVRPPPAQLEEVVRAGGFWFDLGALGAGPEDDEGAMCLFLPAGWFHWLSADSDWHVAWSASFFPDADRTRG